MTTLISATYALHRQKIAVERTLCARSAEESQLAARWAGAWHKLVQRKLDQAEAMAATSFMVRDYPVFTVHHASPSRVLH